MRRRVPALLILLGLACLPLIAQTVPPPATPAPAATPVPAQTPVPAATPPPMTARGPSFRSAMLASYSLIRTGDHSR